MGRAILAQILQQNEDMLPYFYQKCEKSSEAVLTSQRGTQELLDLAIRNCESIYIVLDGIDECPRQELKVIANWFREMVEHLPPKNSDQVRCLFVSQDDGLARKDFKGITSLKITPQDNINDIRTFCSVQATELQQKFDISDTVRDKIVEDIAKCAGGT